MQFISALNVSYPERLAQRPDAFKEFDRMFRATRSAMRWRTRTRCSAPSASRTTCRPSFKWWFAKKSQRARHFHCGARQNHQQVLRAVETDRYDQEFSRHQQPGPEACAPRLMTDTGIAFVSSSFARGPHRRPVRRASGHATVLFIWEAASLLAPSYLLPGRVPVARRLWQFVTSSRMISAISVHRSID